jgi:hypothetical protein
MRTKFAAALAALLLVAATAAAQDAGQGKVSMNDFAGTWVLDASKSQLGMGGPGGGQGQGPVEETMTVARAGDKITVERKIKGQQGERTVNDVITADGKEGDFTAQMRGNEIKGKRTAKWSADGSTLEVSDKANVETQNGPMTFETSSKWTLSDGGKTLTIEQTRTTPRGPQTSKRVYAKK